MGAIAVSSVVLVLLLAVLAQENDNSTESENQSAGGKTYFIQLKKLLISHEGEEKPSYVHIKHYPGESQDEQASEVLEENFFKRKYEQLFGNAPQELKESSAEDAKAEKRRKSPQRIDDEWLVNPNRSVYDLPNITQEIYEAMLESNKLQNNLIRNASTVKFFFERNTNLSSNIVHFDIESLANTSGVIIDAELHVYRLPRENNSTRSNATENMVRLYQMTEKKSDVDSSEDNATLFSPALPPDVHKLANVVYISSNYEGWQVFKVKTVVENWRSGEENLGFLISTVDAHEKEDHVEFAHRERNGGKYQPTLVVYLDRQVTPNRKSSQHRIRKPSKPIRRQNLVGAENPCRRHVWYISFHELGWNNFIIAPSGFMAYKCQGTCKSSTVSSFTNHGNLISISERAGDPLKACCVSNGYKSLLIMFYDKESNVVIKEYEDMVVNNCGCR